MAQLEGDYGSKLGMADRWWVPINWCCEMIQAETGPYKLITKSNKRIVDE
jgi:hypothetical protein